MTTDTQHFKELLLAELSVVESQLASMGRKNPSNPADWQATIPENGIDEADEAEVAGSIEQLENNNGEVENLETQLLAVREALEKIDSGKYGICEIGGEEIEQDRLEANPSARTCKAHMN